MGIYEFAGNMTIGLVGTFFGWWLISAGFIWLWRRFGGKGIMFIAGFLSLLVGSYLLLKNPNFLIGSPTPTNMPMHTSKWPTLTPNPTRTPKPLGSLPTRTPSPAPTLTESQTSAAIERYIAKNGGCLHQSQVTEAMLGQEICISGTVFDISHYDGLWTEINFEAGIIDNILLPDDAAYNIKAGDCIGAYGKVVESMGLRNTNPFIFFDTDYVYSFEGCK